MSKPAALLSLAASDPVAFIERIFFIKPERSGAKLPFKLRDVQREFLSRLAEYSRDGQVRVVVAKARRLGITSATMAMGMTQVLSRPNYHMALLAQLKTPARNIMDYTRSFWDGVVQNAPEVYACGRPECEHADNLRCAFVERTKETWEFRWGSRLQAFTAETKASTRASGFHFLHLTEAAYYSGEEEGLLDAILPTLPKDPDAKGIFVVAESTGNGSSGWFYETYQAAKEAESARQAGKKPLTWWRPLFFPWFVDSRYRRPDLLEDGKLPPDPRFEDEEEYLERSYGLSPAQLAWRRATILDEFRGDVDAFKKEYPSDDREAFLVKGSNIFPASTLLAMKEANASSVVCGYLLRREGNFRFVPSEDGPFRVAQEPKPGVSYLIGADPALGIEETEFTKAGDWSAAVVWRRDGPKLVQVAALRCRKDVEAFTNLVVDLARWYNGACICPERNSGVGRHMIRTLRRLGYHNIWRAKNLRRLEIEVEELLGWATDPTSKQMMISDMQAALAAGTVELYDPILIDELLDYSRKPAGSRERYGPASSGGHDDMADAAMIGLCAFNDNPPFPRPLGLVPRRPSMEELVRRLGQLGEAI